MQGEILIRPKLKCTCDICVPHLCISRGAASVPACLCSFTVTELDCIQAWPECLSAKSISMHVGLTLYCTMSVVFVKKVVKLCVLADSAIRSSLNN